MDWDTDAPLDGWKYHKFKGYKFSTYALHGIGARQTCESFGARLVEINDATEQDLLQYMAAYLGQRGNTLTKAFIGSQIGIKNTWADI